MAMYVVHFTSLVLKAVGESSDIVHHPYSCTLSQEHLNRLSSVLDRNPNASLSASTMNQVLGQTVMPSANASGTIDIPNGWQARRLSFVATVVIKFELGSDDHIIIEGYTDTANVNITPTGEVYIASDMRFYPNMVKRLQLTETQTINKDGVRVNGSVVNDVQTALCLHSFSSNPYNRTPTYAITPSNIINMTLDDMSMFQSVNSMHAVDMRGMLLDNHITPESTSIQNPGKIGGRIAAAIGNAVFESNQGDGNLDSVGHIAGNYTSTLSDTSGNGFFAWLSQVANGAGDFFTYRDVVNCTPNIRPTVLQNKNTIRDSEYWHISNDYTVVATVISQVVSSLLYDMSLSYIEFSFDTKQYDPTLADYGNTATPGLIALSRVLPIHQEYVVGTEVLNKIRQVLRDTMLNVITERQFHPTYGNWTQVRNVNGKIACAIWDRTVMELRIDEDLSYTRYEAPTYASGITTAALTTDKDDLDSMTLGLGHIISTVMEHTQTTPQAFSIPVSGNMLTLATPGHVALL